MEFHIIGKMKIMEYELQTVNSAQVLMHKMQFDLFVAGHVYRFSEQPSQLSFIASTCLQAKLNFWILMSSCLEERARIRQKKKKEKNMYRNFDRKIPR